MSFYTLSIAQRRAWLLEQGLLTDAECSILNNHDFSCIETVLDACSENVIGVMPLPLSVVNDFPCQDKLCTLVLSSEETSVVAGLNKMAKWVRQDGYVKSHVANNVTWGQVFLHNLPDTHKVLEWLEDHQYVLVDYINTKCVERMVARGGGCHSVRCRILKAHTIVVDFSLDTVDAMGANAVNQVAAKLASYLKQIIGHEACMAILSNHQPDHLVRCHCYIKHVPESLGRAIELVSDMATLDTFRAVTHNKGVMNGVDALLIATGNDVRAAEASAHAYASVQGLYKPLSTWNYCDKTLHGTLTMPIPCGVVGGVTKVHPVAKLALKMMKITTRSELAGLAGIVGLLQNLAALRALATEGIVPGHMRLHIDNLLCDKKLDLALQSTLREKCYQHLQTYGSIAMHDVDYYYAALKGMPT